MIVKSTNQNFSVLEQTHPDLFAVIRAKFPYMSDEDKGKIAGLCIEYVIQSGGEVDIFQEDIPEQEAIDLEGEPEWGL